MIERRAFLLGTLALGLAGPAAVARAGSGGRAPPGEPDLRAHQHFSGIDDPAMFDRWVAEHAPETAVMVVRRGGQIFARGHHASPEALPPVASLSKAITASAVASLVRDGRLSFRAPLRDVLTDFFRQYGPPRDPRFLDVTVEQLLVHRSGLLGNPDRDLMRVIRQRRIAQGFGHIAAPQPLIAEHMRRYPLARDPGGPFAYSNTGYLVLTAVIEAAAQRPYEDYCQEAVLRPLGVTGARLNPQARSSSGAGGWMVAGADYLKFYDIFDPRNPLLGNTAQNWIAAARERWGTNRRGGWYSLGVQTARTEAGRQVQHSGLLYVRGRAVPTAVRSFARRKPNGDALFVSLVQPRAQRGGLRELIRAIEGAPETETPMHPPVE